MGLGGKKGGDVVLESRHVIGVFLLMVVVSGAVFTLGYVLGRSQYDPSARAAAKGPSQPATDSGAAKPSAQAKAQPAEAKPAPSDWDLYRSADSKKPEGPRKSDSKAAASKPGAPKPSAQPAAAKGNSFLNAPLIPRGAILLQVAAVMHESDALALAELLQKKKFPAFVLTPGADHYYRVQVGPYADAQSAKMAKRALEHEGFKPIVKR